MIPRIYQDTRLTVGEDIDLDKRASHHLAKVLRCREGDSVALFNGDGDQYSATLSEVSTRTCRTEITGSEPRANESPVHITLLQGLSRNDRMDTTLQKATELGVNSIVPVICRHSNFRIEGARLEKKLSHWRQVVISACEQSGRCVVPDVASPLGFEDALDDRAIADCRIMMDPDSETAITDITTVDERISLLVGPESGFDGTELEMASAIGYQSVRLGPRVLRTETAGPAAIVAIQTLWGDLNY